jgi:hypothetical protein
MLTFIKGPKPNNEVRSFLESKGYEIVPNRPQARPQNLPMVVNPKVVRKDGRFGFSQLKEALTNCDFVVIKTGDHELVIRRFRENDKDEIHIILGTKNVYTYAAVQTTMFGGKRSGNPMSVAAKLMVDIEFGRKPYLDFVPEGEWTFEDLVQRIGWNWKLY